MDEEMRRYLEAMGGRLEAMEGRLEAMEGRFEAMEGRFDAMEGRLMARLNNSEERILNRLDALERDFTNTKGFLVGDSLTSGRRWFDLEARVTKLERGE
jgi:hypothetical protein